MGNPGTLIQRHLGVPVCFFKGVRLFLYLVKF